MLPYSIVSSAGLLQEIIPTQICFEGQFAGEPYSTEAHKQ
jgi:hypothetical protein